MRTVLTLAAGVWVGRKIYMKLAENRSRERDVNIRKKLEQFIRENLPTIQTPQLQKEIENILK